MESKNEQVLPALFPEVDVQIESAKNKLISETIKTDQELEKIEKSFINMQLSDIKDAKALKVLQDALVGTKKLKKKVSELRLELTRPATKWQKDLKAEEDRIVGRLNLVIENLTKVKSDYDDREAAELRERALKRSTALTEIGYQLVNGYYECDAIRVDAASVGLIADGEFDFFVAEGKKHMERKAAEIKRQQDERDAMDKARQDILKAAAELRKNGHEIDLSAFGFPSASTSGAAPESKIVIVDPKDGKTEMQKGLDMLMGKFDSPDQVKSPSAVIPNVQVAESGKIYGPGIQIGFDDCRMQVIEFIKRPREEGEKLSIGKIIDFIKSAKPNI